ncbi:hypothetical protein AUR04nite_34110 [Glutamicibacter uratoxydans]|uniref:Uncharacterized protein n=1 Tax=Glutamicibacter uratoxydans TaxID=43667 RepID=A0A4Y4DRC1_GLUUR|nr:hypothetical protein [Glutamicibacter uratoxydans]GED07879.1 hypothetical protein AUR04nite_34110 [Glutamicibacter uratoxydans]
MIKTKVTCLRAEKIIHAFGVSVLVRLTVPDTSATGYAEQLMQRLTEVWADSPTPRQNKKTILEVDLGVVDDKKFERIQSVLSTEVTLAALRAHSGDLLMFHAGGIARDDGKVAMIIGPSGVGKTTTMRHLGLHYGYVSDETVAVNFQGEVLPYRKPLSIITDGHEFKVQVAPSTLHLLPLPTAPLILSGIALLKRPDTIESDTVLEPIGLAQGLMMAIEQTSYLGEIHRPLAKLASLASKVGGFKVMTVGTPERIHRVVEQIFDSREVPRWTSIMPDENRMPRTDTAFIPLNVVDAVECSDGTVVFTKDKQAILLDGIGPQLWRSSCNLESWQQLINRIEASFGPAPHMDTKSAIIKASDKLIEAGIISNNINDLR